MLKQSIHWLENIEALYRENLVTSKRKAIGELGATINIKRALLLGRLEKSEAVRARIQPKQDMGRLVTRAVAVEKHQPLSEDARGSKLKLAIAKVRNVSASMRDTELLFEAAKALALLRLTEDPQFDEAQLDSRIMEMCGDFAHRLESLPFESKRTFWAEALRICTEELKNREKSVYGNDPREIDTQIQERAAIVAREILQIGNP